MEHWILENNQIKVINSNVDRLGYPLGTFTLPEEYISQIPYIPIFRTCHAFGDWGILSCMPRLLKEKYPNKEVLIPSPELIQKMFKPFFDNNWWGQWEAPWESARKVFDNNPYIDGEFTSFEGMIFCDHTRIYNPTNPRDPLAAQMLRVWGFTEDELRDVRPELYFSEEEINTGNELIKKYFGDTPFNALILSNRHEFNERDNKVLNIINKHPQPYLYYYSGNLNDTIYKNIPGKIPLTELTKNIRIQLYIRTRANINIGTQSGVMDIMPRYTKTYILKHNKDTFKQGNFIQKAKYIT